MPTPERPLGIKVIRGCGRNNFPYLVRDDDKIFCMSREIKGDRVRRFSKFELIEGEARQAFCTGSKCVFQVETEVLESCHSASYLQHLRDQSSLT